MTGSPVPDDVRDFVLEHIDSIAQLEALLLLRKDRSMQWNAAKLSERLYVSEAEAAQLLRRLHTDGFLRRHNEAYQYHCISAELDGLTGRLAACYATQLIPITHVVHAKPGRIQQFAEAFKFRKDP